jgi:hypothetical protein
MAGTPAVYGVRESLKTLRDIDPALRRESVKAIREAAKPLQQAVQNRLGPPMSGMKHKGRTGWYAGSQRVRTKVGGRKAKGADTWRLVSVIVSGTAASIFDMAGRSGSSTPQGRGLVEALSSKHGAASRAAWPGAEATMQQVQADVLRAVEVVQRQANANLRTVTKMPGG